MYNVNEEIIIASTGEVVTLGDIKAGLMKESAQVEARKQKGNEIRKSKEGFSVFIDENFGSFFFNKYNKTLDKFMVDGKYESAMAFRFLYLCTYMDYDNKLRFGCNFRGKERAFMVEKDLQEVLGLSERETRNTKKFLLSLGILKMDSEGVLFVDKMYSKKGQITESFNRESTRVFDGAIRKLYEESKAIEHKKLGLFIKLIPYINFKFNILCFNPKEEVEKLIKPMNMKEVCEIVGYNKTQSSRLKKDLFNIKVNGKYAIGLFETGAGTSLVINPSIFYAGNNLEELKWLNSIFRIVE
ncbi:hypothetical protein [uncultured Clostridium sp.]|uniref:hypothetical protein n=1 Tax=uncultured Clostridium sp. TaxID=59620 RepID=UPI0025850F3B|nr:hypothetical protein [uncultured Clostridium sp.]